MILAIDVKYNEVEKTAKAVGVLFNWLDESPKETIEIIVKNIEEYIPGQFYKRELPCIKKVIEHTDIKQIDLIIVDGHVYVNNEKEYGLGGYVFKEYGIPVVGVAKTPFYKNKETVVEIYRGDSKQPLYVSSIGVDKSKSAQKIKQMHGDFRIPTILKQLDTLTKKRNQELFKCNI